MARFSLMRMINRKEAFMGKGRNSRWGLVVLAAAVSLLGIFSGPGSTSFASLDVEPSLRGKNCGSIKKSGLRVFVSVTKGNARCPGARAMIRSYYFNNRAWVQHGSGVLAETHYTNRRFRGWRCASGSGGGGCTYGNDRKFVLYQIRVL